VLFNRQKDTTTEEQVIHSEQHPEMQTPSPACAESAGLFANKWVKAVIAVVVALALLIGSFALISLKGGDVEDRAARYIKAYYTADYRRLRTSFHYDVDEMFNDMIWVRSQQEGQSWESACKEFGQGYTDFSKAEDSMLKALCKATYEVMRKDSNGTYQVTATAVHATPMEKEEIAAFLQDNNEKYQRYGVKLDDYIDVEKLRKAYRVDVRVLQKYWEDRDPDEWLESVVVARYKGQWRVLTIFDPDIY